VQKAINNFIGKLANYYERAKYGLKNLGLVNLKAGNNALYKGDYKTAKARFKFALKRMPESADCLYGLGHVYYGLKKYDDAIKYLDHALEIDPNHGAANYIKQMIIDPKEIKNIPVELLRDLYNAIEHDYYDQDVKLEEALADFLKDKEGLNILDLACGSGRIGEVIHNEGYAITGVDISSNMLERAGELNEGDNDTYLRLEEAEVTEFLNSNDKNYDIIIAIGLVERNSSLQKIIQAVAKNMDSKTSFIFNYWPGDNFKFDDNFWVFSHSDEYIKKTLTKNGLKIDSIIDLEDTTCLIFASKTRKS